MVIFVRYKNFENGGNFKIIDGGWNKDGFSVVNYDFFILDG